MVPTIRIMKSNGALRCSNTKGRLTSPTIKELIMADSHSTPDTDQSGTERSVIVGYRPNVFDKSTPKIILSGKWLREAGFDTGQQISVKVMNGCIVLMIYGEQEQRLQDELQEVNQKLKRIESTLATLQ